MSEISFFIVQAGLVIMVLALIPCLYRVMVGPNPADRLQAVDTITNLLIGIIVLLSLERGSSFILDVGLALAAFSFIATLGISRYLAEGRVF
jgi:multicomponent Na+:H+ antiporter subunit F